MQVIEHQYLHYQYKPEFKFVNAVRARHYGSFDEMLKKHMEDYIKTNYFGKNDELRRMCAGILSESLCQKPYTEANPAYFSVDNGSSNSILTYEKDSLIPMSKKKLKVIDTPYVHQINALEEFHNGNDLFVATGTGSGKTECFMWPMVSSLINELQNNPSTWQIRGIRALVLYPMNELVSDQLSRLRKMIGDEKGEFNKICNELRGNATILSEIAKAVYPDSDTNETMRAVSVLMALATKSKNKNGLSFFPARLHMFFRGVPGLYGCINPECPDYNSKIGIGKIFTSKRTKCACGGKVFELYNDRSCGTVFLKGYYDASKFDCIWSDRGISDSDKFVSVAVYLSLDGKTPRNSIVKWMNVKTGRLFNDDNFASKKGFVKVCFSKWKINPNAREDDIQVSFSSCPHCEKRKLRLTDFSIKGNEPFFHLVSEQLL